MAIRSGMFNSVNGDRKVDAAFFSLFFSTFIGDGVFPNPSTGLQIVEGQGMQTIVKPGKGWIQGRFVINDSDHIFKHDIADGVLKRIDRVVMRLNHLTRQIEIVLKKGSQASSPTAPTIQRDAEAYELVLADVLINAGTTQITQGNITDQRLNKSLCGIVHGVIDQVDTTTIFNQYQSWFNQYSTGKALEFQEWQTRVTSELEAWIQAEELDFTAWKQDQELTFTQWSDGRKDAFDVWFATIRGILDEEAAGNIMNVINDHKDSPVPHKYYDEGLEQPMLYGLKRDAELNTPAFVYGATESGPLTTINLPNYQQVEDIKNVVETTGGVVVDIHDKRYKTVVSRPYDFVTGDTNVDALALINEDYKARFPEVASKLDLSAGNPKLHIRDGIFLAISSKHLTFFDMETNKILNAMELKDNNFWATFGNQWFEDDKYIYIRGQNGALNTFALGVFDRLTFQFIKGILYTGGGGLSLTYNSVYPGDLVLNEDIMRVGISGSPGIIYSYRIMKDSGGVPTSIMGVGTPTQLANASVRTIFKYKEFVYAISAANTTSFTLQKFSISTPGALTMTEVAKVSVSSSNVGQESKWKALYTLPDGTDWAIVSFGPSQSIQVLNLTLMQNPQFIANAAADTVVAYDSKNKIVYWQESSAGASGMVYNGIRFEPFYISTLDQKTGYWKNKVCYIRSGMTSYNASSYTRTAILGDYAIAYGGKLLFRYGYKNSCELIEEYINEGLKEV